MRKQNLFDLTGEVRKITGNLPLIVGSQAVFAVTDYPPEIARLSVECDFLLLGESFGFRDEVTENLGIFSRFRAERGFHADVLGRATVVLPTGWEDRLVERCFESRIYAENRRASLAVSRLKTGLKTKVGRKI